MNKPNKPKIEGGMFKRILGLLFKFYPVLVPITIFCIIFSAITAAIPSIFIQNVIAIIEKWYVARDWAEAAKEIVPLVLILAGFYVISTVAVTAQSQLMAYITQGFLGKLRKKMFNGMQSLPIKYFDTNKHGDIMSHYTNDIDTLRELVSRSLPQLLQSVIIVVAVFSIMIYYSVWMTLLVITGIFVMTIVSGKIGGGSAKYFIRQQKSVGAAEGFIQ